MRLTQTLAGAAVAAALLTATPAGAIDLTGTWEGKQTCQAFFGEKVKFVIDDDIMKISQSGADINISALDDNFLYDGKVIDDAADPADKGQASFVECATTPANTGFNEMGRADKLLIKSDGIGATFTATSIYSDPSGLDGPEIGTCKWKYTRVDTANPGVPDCTAPPPLSTSGPTVRSKRLLGKSADSSDLE